jgi:hypothetical protein
MEVEVIELTDDELALPLPISWSELRGMKDMAAHYIQHGTKTERRLAQRLAHAAAWIEAEARAIEQQGPVIHIQSVA